MNLLRLLISTTLVICSLASISEAHPNELTHPITWIVQLDSPSDLDVLKTVGHIEVLDILPSKTMALIAPRKTSAAYSNAASITWTLDSHTDRSLSFERNVEVNTLTQSKPQVFTPDDPELKKQWPLNNTKDEYRDIDAKEAWAITTGNSKLKVAIVDTGIAYNHPDLAANIWVNTAEKNGKPDVDDDNNGYMDDIYGYDFKDGDANPVDDQDHGTHVASIIGAVGNNNKMLSGVAWEVQLMALRALGGKDGAGTIWDTVKAIEYAIDKKADIINLSLTTAHDSSSFKKMLERAGKAGILVVAGAGNDNRNIDGNKKNRRYPAFYNYPHLITVAASNKSWWRWDVGSGNGSNYGRTSVDIAAPGQSVYGLSGQNYNKVIRNDGTSLAAPHVSGVAALLLSNEPNLSPEQLKERIVWTGRPADSKSIRKKIRSGRIVNAYNALMNIHELDKDERKALEEKN